MSEAIRTCSKCGFLFDINLGHSYEHVYEDVETGAVVICDDCLDRSTVTRCENCGDLFVHRLIVTEGYEYCYLCAEFCNECGEFVEDCSCEFCDTCDRLADECKCDE